MREEASPAERAPGGWGRVRSGAETYTGRVVDDVVVVVDGVPWGEHAETGLVLPTDGAEWLPPVVPGTFFCAGYNYRAHVEEARARGIATAVLPERPEVGYRANSALAGHDQDIVVPPDAEPPLESEGELVAVIGRPLRRASRDEALDAIFGWTAGNDFSVRGWQRRDRTFWRAKNTDTFKPSGPWVVPAESFDLAAATTTISVDGRAAARFVTGATIFDAGDFLVEISKYITVSAGDVLWLGCDGGIKVEAGQSVEVAVTGLPVLRNRIVSESSPE